MQVKILVADRYNDASGRAWFYAVGDVLTTTTEYGQSLIDAKLAVTLGTKAAGLPATKAGGPVQVVEKTAAKTAPTRKKAG